MRKFKKTIIYFIIFVVIFITGFLSYVKFALPNVGKPEDIKADITASRIERGTYLANSVCVCMDCHSKRDWYAYAGPLVANTLGQGGEEFNHEAGFPGNYYAKNITPYALQDWTDGEILRAISCGVSKNGKALFPVMPHPNYGKMDKEDILAIIAYLRTLKPVKNEVATSTSDFPMSFIINIIPKKAKFSKIPDTNNKVEYGAYLLNAASCNDCHTIQIKGKPVAGMEFAGGFEFPLVTGGIVRSANITPDIETGIGGLTEEAFVNRFKLYTDSTYKPAKINKGDFNTVMPWMLYSTMKKQDLKAIYAYLRTVKAVKNEVIKFSPAVKQ
ncbi:MAG: c-type cytochrome [Bacteroidetes bacterium]|nr:c-type cytochrome [Bacteroidota bacterium]